MSPGPISKVPSELLTLIFDYLRLPDLQRLAHVSSLYRAVARAHPTFWRDIHIFSMSRFEVELLADRLQSTTFPGLHIAVDVSYMHSSHPNAAMVFCAIERSLSRVRILKLTINLCDAPDMLGLICRPAPFLEELILEDPYVNETAALPANLFGGQAPRLRDVSLSGCILPQNTITAFTHVQHLTYTTLFAYESIPTDLFRQFPELRELFIHSNSDIGNLDQFCEQFRNAPPLDSLNLGMTDEDAYALFMMCPPLLEIPQIEFYRDDDILRLLSNHLPGPLGIELVPNGSQYVWYTVRSHSRGWKRTFSVSCSISPYSTVGMEAWWPSRAFYQTDAISRRLTTLTMHSSLAYLSKLLGALPACEALHVSIDGPLPPAGDGERPLVLPGLKRITLRPTSPGPTSIDSSALGQFISRLIVPPPVAVALQLDGISLSGDVESLGEYGLIVDRALSVSSG